MSRDSRQNPLYSQLDDMTTCPICLEALRDPRHLPCIHTFCLTCMETHCKDKDPGEEVPCPVCVQPFVVPLNGISDLPKSFIMNQLMEMNKGTTNMEETKLKEMIECKICSDCDSSTTVTATSFCKECDQYTCDRCSKVCHKQHGYQSHHIIKISEKMSEMNVGRLTTLRQCERHFGEDITLFCNYCKLPICDVCEESSHREHHCISIKKSGQIFVNQMTGDIKHVAAYGARHKELIEQINTRKCKFMECLGTIQSEITQKSAEFNSFIKAYDSQLLQELDVFKCNQMKEMEERKSEIERQLVMAESFNKYCQDVKNNGTPAGISRLGNDLHSRAENILSSSTNLEISELGNPPKFISSRTVIDVSDNLSCIFGNLCFEDAVKSTTKINTKVTSLVNRPRVICDINAPGHITGLALLGSSLYIIGETSEIHVYDVNNTLTLTHTLTIANSVNLHRIIACSHYNCLYIRDRGLKVLHRYSLRDNRFTRWPFAGKCYGLSVTKSLNLLATLWDSNRLQEYTTDGNLIREIVFEGRIEYPLHSIQLGEDQYVVSHEGRLHRVCIVDSMGHLIQSYGSSSGLGPGKLNKPRQMAIDELGHVLVTDCDNNTVQLLSPTLKHLGNVNIPGPAIKGLRALHLDELNHRLYIGDYNGRIVCLDAIN